MTYNFQNKVAPQKVNLVKQLIIVGDRFAPFAERHPWAITFTKFTNKWESSKKAPSSIKFVLGQGLSDDQRTRIVKWLEKFNRHNILNPEQATRWMTHKHEAKNILISKFIRSSQTTFEGYLLLDDRNELLSDHMSAHISGMAETEAIRQAFLAVTEQFYLPRGDAKEKVFITSKKNVAFKRFLFPLPATIKFEMLNADLTNENRLKFKARIQILQGCFTCADVYVDYLVMNKEILGKTETDQAENTYRQLSQQLKSMLS